jgi:uncharacterized protein (DUF1015 family)
MAANDRQVWLQVCERNPNNILTVMPETYPWDPAALRTAQARGPEILASEYREIEGWLSYRVDNGDHGQTGLVCMVAAESYPSRVRPHEEVREAVVPAVVANYESVGLSVNPVSLMTRSRSLADWLGAETADRDPLVEFVADDGVSETVWQLPTPPPGLIEEITPTYIADGHHRAAAATQIARDGAAFGFMAVIFPAHEMRILGFHRLLRRCRPEQVEELERRLTAGGSPTPPVPDAHQVAVCDGKQWKLIRLAPPENEQLDPQLLQDEILGPIFGITDPATEPRLEFVPGIVSSTALAQGMEPGDLAFVTRAVSVDAVLALADAGRTVPPKSTWFSPKARAGLFVQRIG